MKILHSVSAKQDIQTCFIYQVETQDSSEKPTLIEQAKELIQFASDVQKELRNENEDVFKMIADNWETLPANMKFKAMAAEGQKGTIDYVKADSTFIDALAVYRTNLPNYKLTKPRETFGIIPKIEFVIKNWKENMNESVYDFFTRLDALSGKEAVKQQIIKEIKKFVNSGVSLNNFTSDQLETTLSDWYLKDYLPGMQEYLDGTHTYTIAPMSNIDSGDRNIHNLGGYVGNAVVLNNGKQKKVVSVSHVIKKTTDQATYETLNDVDIAVVNLPESEMKSFSSHPLTKLSDNEINAKEIYISGNDYNKGARQYEQALVKGRCFKITEDMQLTLMGRHVDITQIEQFATWTQPGTFVMLIEQGEEDDYSKLSGVSASPVFFNNPATNEREVVGNFTAKTSISIGEKEYLVIYFNGPSILKEAFKK